MSAESPKSTASRNSWLQQRELYFAARAALKNADTQVDLAMKAAGSAEDERKVNESSARAALAAQEKVVTLTRNGTGSLLQTYGEVEVFEWWIKVPGGGGPAKGARASVSRVGSLDTYNTVEIDIKKKGGLGGAAAGALIAGPVGAVIGFGMRRKTEAKTTNTPHTVDTRQELVEVTGEGFAYVVQFPGWGEGTNLANAVNRQASSITTAQQELPKRIEQLEKLQAELEAIRARGVTSVGRANSALNEAWRLRKDAYERSVQCWREYLAVRPGPRSHVLALLIPGREKRTFNFWALASLVAAITAGAYSATGNAPSPNTADVIGITALVSFGASVVLARGLQPKPRTAPSPQA